MHSPSSAFAGARLAKRREASCCECPAIPLVDMGQRKVTLGAPVGSNGARLGLRLAACAINSGAKARESNLSDVFAPLKIYCQSVEERHAATDVSEAWTRHGYTYSERTCVASFACRRTCRFQCARHWRHWPARARKSRSTRFANAVMPNLRNRGGARSRHAPLILFATI